MAQKAVTLSQTAFPLYTIRIVGEKYFLVAGGGGSAKTGIVNAIEIYELKDDQGKCIANRISHFETEDAAVMNSAVSPLCSDSNYCIATGQDDKCQVYTLRKKTVALKPQEQERNNENPGVRKRKSNLTSSEAYNNAVKTTMFDIEKNKSVKTDFSKEGPFQKCVTFSCDQKLLITGGADGYVRVWKHPNLEKLYEVKGHKNEIDDLDISCDNSSICTVSKDNKGSIWKTKDGSKNTDLVWDFKTNAKYRMRSCRFGRVEGRPKEYKLYTTHIPIVRGTKSVHCYITKWNTTNYKPEKVMSTGVEVLSALAISSDGTYLGLGTLSGSISVFISFSLQKLYHVKEAHGIFVTGLEFVPCTNPALEATGNYDFTLLSISADNQIKIHQEAPRAMYSPLWAILGFIIMVYLMFWIISTF